MTTGNSHHPMTSAPTISPSANATVAARSARCTAHGSPASKHGPARSAPMLNEYAQISHQKFLAREREKLRTDKRLRDAAPELLRVLRTLELLLRDRTETSHLLNAALEQARE